MVTEIINMTSNIMSVEVNETMIYSQTGNPNV